METEEYPETQIVSQVGNTYFSRGQQAWGFSTPEQCCHGLGSMQNWY